VDSFETKITSTSAYFGVRSVTRGAARLLGLPAPVALVLASLSGSIALETTKASFRNRVKEQEAKKKLSLSNGEKPRKSNSSIKKEETAPKNATSIQSLFKSIQSVISLREVEGDITKWVVFDLLLQATPRVIDGVEKSVLYFGIGSISAITGNFVKLLPTRDLQDKTIQINREKKLLVSYSQAALEGGVLFMTYALSGPIIQELVPSELNMQFFFNTLLTSAEQSVERGVLEIENSL